MCGDEDSPLLKLKAAKTKVLLGWAIELLRAQGGSALLNECSPSGVEGTQLLQCGASIAEFYEVLAREGRTLREDAFPQLEACAVRAAENYLGTGRPGTSKWHAFAIHLVPQMMTFGNCTFTHNYLDESENFSTRERGNHICRTKFAETMLAKWYREFVSENYY